MNRLFHPDDSSISQIYNQLAHLRAVKGLSGSSPLTPQQLSPLIETAFWASLEFNETRPTRVCLSVAASGSFADAARFQSPVPYHETQIARLAPAVPQGGCLLVSEGLEIWGFGRDRTGGRSDTVTIDIWEPGTLRVGMGPFQPFAVLRGRANSVLAVTSITLADYLQRLLNQRLPARDFWRREAVWRDCLALRDMARIIVAQGHGGILLIVPGGSGEWSASLDPFAYRFDVPDTRVRDAVRVELDETRARGEMIQQISEAAPSEALKDSLLRAAAPRSRAIAREVEAVASLAGVDGAIVLTSDLQVLGFGAKIATGSAGPVVCITDAGPGSRESTFAALEDLGGTRHQSSARFAGAHRDTLALVFSQDRHLSVMHWDQSMDAVAVVRHAEWWV
jgi:hypothetical protein